MVGWHHRLNGHGFGWTLEVVMDREAWCAVVPPAKARDLGLIPGLRGSPGEGNGNALQYSCLGKYLEVHQLNVEGINFPISME